MKPVDVVWSGGAADSVPRALAAGCGCGAGLRVDAGVPQDTSVVAAVARMIRVELRGFMVGQSGLEFTGSARSIGASRTLRMGARPGRVRRCAHVSAGSWQLPEGEAHRGTTGRAGVFCMSYLGQGVQPPVKELQGGSLLSPDPLRTLAVVLTLAAVPGPAWAQSRAGRQVVDTTAIVQGTVLEHETGAPLAGAAVSLASGPGGTRGVGTRVTGQQGEFLFQNVPPGTYRLRVDLFGYRSLQNTLRVASSSDVGLVLELSVSPVELEPIVIVVPRRRPDYLQGFESRRLSIPGTFITREDIEERNPNMVSDLFRMVPGARVVPVHPYGYGVLLRGGCRPDIWVDGVKTVGDIGIDQFLIPMDVEAIEVYRGVELPAQFGTNPCGAVVVWTRVPQRAENQGSFWKRLAFAAAFVTMALLLTR